MALNVDVKANTTPMEASMRRMTAELNKLGQEAARVTGKKFKLIDESDLGDLQKYAETMRQIIAMHPSIRSAISASKQNPASPSSINWQNVPLTPSQVKTMFSHLGGGQNRFEKVDAQSIGDHVGKAMQRFFGGVGGGAGQVGGSAISGAMGGGGGAGGFGGLLRGGLIGAGLFGALKAGQAVSDGMDNAKTLAIDMDKLKRSMGDVGVSFQNLKYAASMVSSGLEINSVEAGKLMQEFNRLSGGVKSISDLAGGTRTGVGLSKALGLDPSQGVGFIAGMRQINGGGNADGDRKLALMIGDVIVRSGMNARADEALQAIQGFASATARISLSSPNIEGFGGAYSSLVGARIAGLTPENAASMLGQANSAMQKMGGYGEASHTFMMSAFNRQGELNPIQAEVLAEGGLFGTREQAFGKNSQYRKFMLQNGKTDAEIDALIGKNGNVTNFQSAKEMLGTLNLTPELRGDAFKNIFGLQSRNQAMAMMMMNPEEMGKTQALLKGQGVDISKYDKTGIETLSKIANAGGLGDLNGIASSLIGRKGKGSLDAKEKDILIDAMAKAQEKGGKEGFASLQEALAKIAANKDKEETDASKMLDAQKSLETAMTDVGDKLLGPLIDIKSLIMNKLGISSRQARDGAKALDLKDVDERFDSQISGISSGSREQNKTDARDLERLKARRQQVRYGNGKWSSEEERKAEEARLTDEINQVEAGTKERNRKSAEQIGALEEEKRKERQKVEEKYRPAVMQSTASSLSDIDDPEQRKNLKAYLDTIAASEGADYNTLVGGSKIDDLSKHPNKVGLVTGDGKSTAAGRYQITGTTWKGVARKLGLSDFSPESQDKAAIELLRQRGALDDVLAGRWDAATAKLGDEWQSLPSGTSKHQGKRSKEFFDATLKSALERNGAETPIPGGNPLSKVSETYSRPRMSLDPLSMTFRLIGEDGRQRAEPINMSVPIPSASGR